MKTVLVLMLCLLKHYNFQTVKKQCNIPFLNAFGLQGSPVPTPSSVVCMSVATSCCSKRDELFIHKQFEKIQKAKFKARYDEYTSAYPDIEALIAASSSANLNGTIAYYVKNANNSFVSNQLIDTYDKIKKINATLLLTDFKTNKPKMVSLGKRIKRIRQRFLCSVCDIETNSAVDIAKNVITYSNEFCTDLSLTFLPPLKFYYDTVYSYLKLLDKFTFLATNRQLFGNLKNYFKINKIKNLTDECSRTDGKQNCTLFCSEFKFNEASVLFDGDMAIISDYLKNYNARFKEITGPTPAPEVFKKRMDIMHTVLEPKLPKNEIEYNETLQVLNSTNATNATTQVQTSNVASADSQKQGKTSNENASLSAEKSLQVTSTQQPTTTSYTQVDTKKSYESKESGQNTPKGAFVSSTSTKPKRRLEKYSVTKKKVSSNMADKYFSDHNKQAKKYKKKASKIENQIPNEVEEYFGNNGRVLSEKKYEEITINLDDEDDDIQTSKIKKNRQLQTKPTTASKTSDPATKSSELKSNTPARQSPSTSAVVAPGSEIQSRVNGLARVMSESSVIFQTIYNMTLTYGNDEFAILPVNQGEKPLLYTVKLETLNLIEMKVIISKSSDGANLIASTKEVNFNAEPKDIAENLFANEILMSLDPSDMSPEIKTLLLLTDRKEISGFLNDHDVSFDAFSEKPVGKAGSSNTKERKLRNSTLVTFKRTFMLCLLSFIVNLR